MMYMGLVSVNMAMCPHVSAVSIGYLYVKAHGSTAPVS